jgi:predicted NBD/HSP70 family sugar kinase
MPARTRHGGFTSVNAKVARSINRSIILYCIRQRQPISRTHIAQITGLNKSTVSNIVDSLLAEELIDQEESQEQSVGRSPINLRLRTGKHLSCAISVDSEHTRVALIDLDGDVAMQSEISSDTKDPRQLLAQCADSLSELRKKTRGADLIGIGVTVAGIVDSLNTRVVFAPNLGWQDLDLGSVIREVMPNAGPVFIENDAKASALAELWFGRPPLQFSNFVFLSIGRGIGTGIVVDRKPLFGASHAAGEFGHMTVHEGGEECMCGNRGCWEAYASDRATVSAYEMARGKPLDTRGVASIMNVIDAAHAGETVARDVLRHTGRYIGIGIANIIKAADPEAVIIGGRITQAWDLIYDEIMAPILHDRFFENHTPIVIRPSSLPVRPALMGAAALVLRHVFADVQVST